MLNKYYKYLPWLILGNNWLLSISHLLYKRTAFDVFYLTIIFMIVYILLLFLHENYLKYRYKDFLLTCWAILRKIAIHKTIMMK